MVVRLASFKVGLMQADARAKVSEARVGEQEAKPRTRKKLAGDIGSGDIDEKGKFAAGNSLVRSVKHQERSDHDLASGGTVTLRLGSRTARGACCSIAVGPFPAVL